MESDKALGAAGGAVPVLASQRHGPEAIVEAFEEADANGDGYLTPDEHRRLFEISFAADDLNGDGAIDREELARSMVRNSGGRLALDSPLIRTVQTTTFPILDRNNNGLVELDEMLRMAPTSFHSSDEDGDGRLSLQEMVSKVPGLQAD